MWNADADEEELVLLGECCADADGAFRFHSIDWDVERPSCPALVQLKESAQSGVEPGSLEQPPRSGTPLKCTPSP